MVYRKRFSILLKESGTAHNNNMSRASRQPRLQALAAMAIVGAVILGGCASDSQRGQRLAETGLKISQNPVREVRIQDATAYQNIVEATRVAGVELFRQSSGANAVVSPSSFMVALSMLADGAKGETLKELENLIGAKGDLRRDAFAAFRGTLQRFAGNPEIVQSPELPDSPILHLATQVVVDDLLIPAEPYLDILAEVYDAGVQHLDLGSTKGKLALDKWVKENSGGLVKKSAIKPNADLRLVLQDVIVLAARWAQPFDKYDTASREFTLADGNKISIATMVKYDRKFALAKVDGWQAIRLPYAGDELHADFLLPPIGIDPASATPELLIALDNALQKATPQLVYVQIPKLDIRPESPLDLTDPIAALGAPTVLARDGIPDLTGIGRDIAGGTLYLSQAWQQAVLQVDEAGTRAAAVTELGIHVESAPLLPDRKIVFDRPFAIVIAHTETSWPLFQAVVRDPR